MIGVIKAGQWIGEEVFLMDLPITYNAIAGENCKLLKIHVQDFKECVPEDVKKRILKKVTRKKIRWIRDRLEELHESRLAIAN
jgi:CRP-like cAMP-binding protein